MVALFILGVSLSTLMEVQLGGGGGIRDSLGFNKGHWGSVEVIRALWG